jgi:hypothetical protein
VIVVNVGAGRNRDCIPAVGNYDAFWRACKGGADGGGGEGAGAGALLAVARDAGHMQFLDAGSSSLARCARTL